MLYIFTKDEKLGAVLSNDSPLACPYIDPLHTEKLNGESVFEFSIPASHEDASFVVEENLVAFKDLDGDYQLFIIRQVEEVHEGSFLKTAFCESAALELLDEIIQDVRPEGSAAFALSQALTGTRWELGTVDDLGLNSTNFYYESALSAVYKVAQVWRGELRFRIQIVDREITKGYVDLLQVRGSITGKRFEYTKDITSITRKTDSSNVKTALFGRGKGEQTGDGYGRRITFADVSWSVASGDPIDKPQGQEWVGDPDALTAFGRKNPDSSVRHRFGVMEDSEETDPAILLQKTWEVLQKQKLPLVQYALTVVDLEQITGYDHEKVRLGDTVIVRDREFNPPLTVAARVIEIQRAISVADKANIKLGNFMPNTVDELSKVKAIESKLSFKEGIWDNALANLTGNIATDWLVGEIDTLRNAVRAGTGTVTITGDKGILITDNAVTPTKAIQLLGGIFSIANSKDPVSGEWEWTTFGDGDGFTADLLRSGKIQTSLVQIVGEVDRFFWDTSGLYAVDGDDPSKYLVYNSEGLKGYAGGVKRLHLGSYAPNKFGLELRDPTGSQVILNEDGILQTWQEGRCDNVASSYPLVLNIYIPEETKSIKKCYLRVRPLAFRAYETATASYSQTSQTSSNTGGSGYASTSESGGSTSYWTVNNDLNIDDYLSSSSFIEYQNYNHNHGISPGTQLATSGGGTVTWTPSGDHTHKVYYHQHRINIPSHNHTIYLPSHSHSVTIPSHSHSMVYGIYLGSTANQIGIKINGVDRTSVLGGYIYGDRYNIDVKAYLNTGQWNTIELSSSVLGRIDATVFIQALMGV